MNESDEILDVVNENDQVTGTIRRGDMMQLRDRPGSYLRTPEAFIQRSNGDIWMPRRAHHKTIAPGGLDMSVAGHVLSGETYEQALLREAKEETGLSISLDNVVQVADFTPTENLFYFRKLYVIHTDEEPQTDAVEHTGADWIPLDEVEAKIQGDVPTKETVIQNSLALKAFLGVNS